MVSFNDLLTQLTEARASDLHLKVGAPPVVRVNGRLQPLPNWAPLTPDDTESIASELLSRERSIELEQRGETDFAHGISGVGRFRVSALRQRGTVSLVLRRVLTNPPSLEQLALPSVLKQLAHRPNGLILVTGPGDAGKTTTVSAMLDEVNKSQASAIVTIEDPIEILHADKQGFFVQREVGSDTPSHLDGLTRALRHDPDVLYVDAIPDVRVLDQILSASTSRLVFAVIPSLGAADAVQRLINYFPAHLEYQARQQLMSVVQGVLSQRLIPRMDGRGRVAVFEVLVTTARVQESVLQRPGAQDLQELMKNGDYHGMQTMDQHLLSLYRSGMIDVDTAMSNATDVQSMRVELHSPGST